MSLADQLFCNNCKAMMSFLNTIGEEKFGVASCFFIKCKACAKMTPVFTDKQHVAADGKEHFDINTSTVLCK